MCVPSLKLTYSSNGGGTENENSTYSNVLLDVLLATEEDEYQGVICQPYDNGPRANGNDV